MALVDEGNIDGALDACRNMRLEPDIGRLGHTKRAIVNFLVLMLNDPEGFDRTKFAEGAIKLTKGYQKDQQEMIIRMEEQATQLMLQFQHKKLVKATKEAETASNAKDGAQGAKADQRGTANDEEDENNK